LHELRPIDATSCISIWYPSQNYCAITGISTRRVIPGFTDPEINDTGRLSSLREKSKQSKSSTKQVTETKAACLRYVWTLKVKSIEQRNYPFFKMLLVLSCADSDERSLHCGSSR
jgi:hypothetical protein